jgi:hypothetical protein
MRPGANRTIYLDDNAAGLGWFVDATLRSDSEFTTPGNQGEQHRIDLLTVLEHELGHVLGLDHTADGVMAESLTASTRRTPTPLDQTDHLARADGLYGIGRAASRLELLSSDELFALFGREHQRPSGRSW